MHQKGECVPKRAGATNIMRIEMPLMNQVHIHSSKRGAPGLALASAPVEHKASTCAALLERAAGCCGNLQAGHEATDLSGVLLVQVTSWL